jgi:hypothetical protein
VVINDHDTFHKFTSFPSAVDTSTIWRP